MRLLHFHFKNQNSPPKDTRAQRDVCPGFSVSIEAKFPVAPAESAPMFLTNAREILCYFEQQEAQLSCQTRATRYRGQSSSQNMVLFDVLGMVSYILVCYSNFVPNTRRFSDILLHIVTLKSGSEVTESQCIGPPTFWP